MDGGCGMLGWCLGFGGERRGRRLALGRGFGGGPKKCGELRGCPKNDVLEPPKMTKREAPTSQPVLGAFPI